MYMVFNKLIFVFFRREPPPLQTHNNSNIILRLPAGKRTKDIKWLSVWCRRFTVSETYCISFFLFFLHGTYSVPSIFIDIYETSPVSSVWDLFVAKKNSTLFYDLAFFNFTRGRYVRINYLAPKNIYCIFEIHLILQKRFRSIKNN